MNWISNILGVLPVILAGILIWSEYRLKYHFDDGRTIIHRKWRKRVLWLALAALVLTYIGSLIKDEQSNKGKQNDRKQISDLTNQLAVITTENFKLREEVSQGFRDISNEFSTNAAFPFAIRLAVLDGAGKRLSEERLALQRSHELFSAGAMDIKTLRAERENELAMQENAKRQAWIQQQIDDIKGKEQSEAITRYQQRKDLDLLNSEKILAVQILPIFDYAIEALGKMLEDISNQAGEKRYSDFPDAKPTVYTSGLVKDGIIINGSNFICIGTNSAWNFKISTTVAPPRTSPISFRPPLPQGYFDNSLIFREPFVRIDIISRTTNGESVLTITPCRDWHPDFPGSSWEPAPVTSKLFYSRISIKLQIPNGLNIDEFQSVTNYTSAIEEAIRRLIGAQDQQSPLTIKVKQ